MRFKKILIALTMLLATSVFTRAQDVALKTNLLYDATLTPSVAVEFGLAPKWSFDISGAFNAWPIHDRIRKLWIAQPEWRYWFCRRFSGHFLALHLHGGQYNLGNLNIGGKNFLGTNLKSLEDHRYEGWFVGAGIGYGYSWILSKHWNFEAEIGIGWAYTRYDKYPCSNCGAKLAENHPHNYFGPTKAALNIIYVF